ncbi:MAG: hypothetical protein HY959_06145 [Ignavibacteriae bacterium]|nr:hypothetical protein [Ignavibacteriota bacterium]
MEKDLGNLFSLLKELAGASVHYVVCGGVACVLQGVERSTYDLDLAVSFEKENLEKLIEITKKFDLIPRIPEPVENLFDEKKRKQWIEEKNAVVYTFVSRKGPLQLDIFLSYPGSFDDLFKNVNIIQIENINVLVSTKEELLFAKRNIIPPRKKDLLDIEELEKLLDDEKKNKN